MATYFFSSNNNTSFSFLIKPTDALISQIYFCQETLHVSGSSCAHYQEFSAVRSAQIYVMQVWWHLSSTTRSCLKAVNAECTAENSRWWAEELPEICRVSWQKYIWDISASVGFIIKKFVTMHGHMNVKNSTSLSVMNLLAGEVDTDRLSHSA